MNISKRPLESPPTHRSRLALLTNELGYNKPLATGLALLSAFVCIRYA